MRAYCSHLILHEYTSLSVTVSVADILVGAARCSLVHTRCVMLARLAQLSATVSYLRTYLYRTYLRTSVRTSIVQVYLQCTPISTWSPRIDNPKGSRSAYLIGPLAKQIVPSSNTQSLSHCISNILTCLYPRYLTYPSSYIPSSKMVGNG